jgi:hypothetical protein
MTASPSETAARNIANLIGAYDAWIVRIAFGHKIARVMMEDEHGPLQGPWAELPAGADPVVVLDLLREWGCIDRTHRFAVAGTVH